MHTLKYASIFKRVYPDRFCVLKTPPETRKRMSEAKLTDIHFLVVFVFCKHPQGLEAHIENEVFKYAFPARFGVL